MKCLFEFKCTLKVLEYNIRKTCEETRNASPVEDNQTEPPEWKERSLKNFFKKIGNAVSTSINKMFLSNENANRIKIKNILKTEDEELINCALDYWNLLEQMEKASFLADRAAFWV